MQQTSAVRPRVSARRALIIAAAALSACSLVPKAHVVDRQLADLDNAPLCCATSKQIPIPGTLQGSLQASLTPASPVFVFPPGRSRAYGFELPEVGGPYELEVRSLAGPGYTTYPSGNAAQMFLYPAVLFLDQQRNVITDEVARDLVAECIGGRASCSYGFNTRLPVPEKARYAVLHTAYPKIGTYYSTTPQWYRADSKDAGYPLVYSGRVQQVFAQFAALGDVVVVVRKISLEPAPASKPEG